MIELHPADVAALAVYFVLVTVLGLWTARHVKTMGDFVMPRKFGKTLMVFYGFGSGTHSDQAVSVASKSYSVGVSGIWYQWLWLFPTPFYWLIASVMRRFRAITTADVFELRYNQSVAVLFALVGLLQYTVSIGVMLKGSAHVIEAATAGSVNANWAIGIMTVLFVAYGMAGGLHAAILTDFIQGVLTIAFSFLLLPFILNAVGGMEGLREQLPADKLSLVAPAEIGVFYVAVIALNGLVGIVAQPHTMSTCAAGRTELDGQVGWMCGNLTKRVCTIAWMLIGVAGFAYFTRLGQGDINPDNIFGEVARRFLPQILPGLLGLFLAGLLASVMSSCDAFMVAIAGLFAENIYKPLVSGRSERHYLWVARIASLGVVASGVAFAYWLEGVVAGLEIFWKLGPMLGIAFWVGLFWRHMNAIGAWTSTLVAFGVWWLTTQTWFITTAGNLPGAEALRFVFHGGSRPEIYLPWQMIFYLSAGLITGIAASALTARPDKEKLDRFYALVRTPILPGEVVDAPCTLPAGVEPAATRKLLPLASFEIYRPSRQMIAGFLAGWVAVAVLIATVVWIVRG
ncbi:MAG: sodium:solute symporter family protein [Thermoguttaceae bacterium]|jgi:Na+/proline symporter|nr:sodium:solute symporter family protein [Thermoguttaceae bacterium]